MGWERSHTLPRVQQATARPDSRRVIDGKEFWRESSTRLQDIWFIGLWY